MTDERDAIGVDAAALYKYDAIACSELIAKDEPLFRVDHADGRPAEVDCFRIDNALERRCLTAAPRRPDGVAGCCPAIYEVTGAFAVVHPGAVTQCKIRVHNLRQRPDHDEIIDDHGDCVLGERVVVCAAGDAPHGIGNEIFCPEPLDDECPVCVWLFPHVGRFAAAGGDFGSAKICEVASG